MSAVTNHSQVSSVITADTPVAGQPVELQPEEIPKASQDALYFLDSFEEEDFKNLLFEDNLVTTSDTGKELGEFNVSITPTEHQGQECYLVHANSHGAIDSVPCGTSITAYVTRRLDTLEQQHHEYVKLENHPLDRKTFIVKQEENYVINRVITQGEDVQRMAQTHSFETMKGFISEGSNLLLQRLLIKKGLIDNFQLIAFDSDATLCNVLYKPLDDRSQTIDEKEYFVKGIERTINSLTDLPTTWQSYFTKDGHLTSRVQVGSPVTMRLLIAPPEYEEDEVEEKPTFGKKKLDWEEDVQMYSKFLDRKEELKGDHNVYMRHHPELKALMADFLQFLLLRKPDDVLDFAADYFSSFATGMPVTTPYMQSAVPSPFPNSRTNTKIMHLSKSGPSDANN